MLDLEIILNTSMTTETYKEVLLDLLLKVRPCFEIVKSSNDVGDCLTLFTIT